MDVAAITEQMRNAIGADSGLGKTLKFDFGDEGKVFIDGAASPNTVSNDDNPADTTVKVSLEDFLAMADGKLDGMSAFMQGKLKVMGDMSVAMKLQTIFAKMKG
jgi:putative sterol carrier protein